MPLDPGLERAIPGQGPDRRGRHDLPRPGGRGRPAGEGGGPGQGGRRHQEPALGRPGAVCPGQRLGHQVDLRRRDRGRRRAPASASTRSCCPRSSRPPRSSRSTCCSPRSRRTAGCPVGHIGIEAQIETTRGLINVEEICAASPRLETIIFGPADFAASMEMPVLTGGVQIPEYPGDHFHYVFSKILMAGRANGLQVIDGPFLHVRELDALRDFAQRTRGARLRRQVGAHPRPGGGPERGLLADPGAVRPRPRHLGGLPTGHRGRPARRR